MIRLVLVDSHQIMRQGLRALLVDQPGIEVVGEVATSVELLDQLSRTPTDVVLLAVNLPEAGTVAVVGLLHQQYPTVRVLALSMLETESYVYQLLDAGVTGYVLKNAGLDEVVHAIRTVASGRPFLCTEMGFRALARLRYGVDEPLSIVHPELPNLLSIREKEVLQLIAEGLTNVLIADRLFVSKRTIETHRQNILAKTQMKNTASLIRYALSEGIIQ